MVTTALSPFTTPPRRVIARSCCRRAYLRGALLGGGSLSGPRAPHLEIRTVDREGAALLASVAEAEGLHLGVVERERHAAAYAKSAGAIAGIVLAAGASGLVLALEEQAVMGATKSSANRLANADHANLVRTSRAAQAQLRAIRRLARSGGLDRLSPELRELAELRLEDPSLSVRDLGLKARPPLTKATAYRRLRKLARLAEG